VNLKRGRYAPKAIILETVFPELIKAAPGIAGIVIVVIVFLRSQKERDALFLEAQALRDKLYIEAQERRDVLFNASIAALSQEIAQVTELTVAHDAATRAASRLERARKKAK
jgi:Tfp pilus assembly protein PilN